MDDQTMPTGLVEARRTPTFRFESVPVALAKSHRTTVWAELRVQAGVVRFVDRDNTPARDLRVGAGETAIIVPGVEHHVEPSTDAEFYVQFFQEPNADLSAGGIQEGGPYRSGPWEPRGRDLDSPEEIREMVTRQYVDVLQDELLAPYFTFGPGFIDWQAHIGLLTDYWCHVVLFAPDYDIDIIEHHRPLHDRDPFTPALFQTWIEIFDDTVDGGWAGPLATMAKARARGMAWAMAHRFLGAGAWQPSHP
jgi:hemoglobin